MARERRKVRMGRVVSDKMDKTVVVAVRWQQRHTLYGKSIRRVTNFYAHDRDNQYKLGDLVRIEETSPISRTKHWRVIDLLERREVVDVKPAELDEGLLSLFREEAALEDEQEGQDGEAPEEDAE